MTRLIGVTFWLAAAVWGVVLFRNADAGWTWRGREDLPKNYRLSDSDWQDVEMGSARILYTGRYLRRMVTAGHEFTVRDLAPAPEIEVSANLVPRLVPLEKQAAAAALNAGRMVSIWKGAARLAADVEVAALLCPGASSQPTACQAVLLVNALQDAALAPPDGSQLTLLPAPRPATTDAPAGKGERKK